MTKKLYKTTIIVWSEWDPNPGCADNDPDYDSLTTLAREAHSGDAYCSKMSSELIEDPTKDPDWDDTEFFMLGKHDE